MDLQNNKEEKDKALYENVLNFPHDTDYVKYFEKIPHPDKIDPALLGILEAMPKENLNRSAFGRGIEFESIKNFLNQSFRLWINAFYYCQIYSIPC